MTLYNETLLGSYLAHTQANIRRLARLDFELANHPDSAGKDVGMSDARKEMREDWDKLASQCWKLLELKLKPFNELAGKGSYHRHANEGAEGPRCLRWNFGKLKKMADKYRRKEPEFTMLKSWDLEAKKRPLTDTMGRYGR